MKSLILICLAYILMSEGCQKKPVVDAIGLPPPTQIGANTFGALINGQVFIPQRKFGENGSPISLSYFATGPYIGLTLVATDTKNSPYYLITFHSSSALVEGQTYPLQATGANVISTGFTSAAGNYTIAPPMSGQLTITKLDLANNII